jgi:hypothetical protein
MSEIDRYLRDMSRRLAGAGPAGQRALAEIEDHLRAAADEGIARGLTADAAEHEAVAHFGKPAHIARQLLDAHRVAHRGAGPAGGRLGQVLASARLIVGLTVGGLGACCLAAAAVMYAVGQEHPSCTMLLIAGCGPGLPWLLTGTAGATLVGAAMVLLGKRVAVWLVSRPDQDP